LSDIARFTIFMLAASGLFLAVLTAATRKRAEKPSPATLIMLTLIVVVCGMLFARYGHILFRFPWWIYYGLPASLTFLLPPLVLKMKGAEAARYVPMAVLIAPAIHIFFSLFVGWHDYMPFPAYIPSLAELIHRLARPS
jgi:hypothetical protein